MQHSSLGNGPPIGGSFPFLGAPYIEAMAKHHLTQLNVAKLKAPLDRPSMAGFLEALEPTNALADGWPGFVW